MIKEVTVLYFLIAFLLIVVAFYVGFSWDVLAFTGAATRVTRELMTGVGGVNIYKPTTSSPAQQGGLVQTSNV